MAIIDKFCPKCMNLLKKKDTKCSKCGMLVSDMKKLRENQSMNKDSETIEKIKESKKQDESDVLKDENTVNEVGSGANKTENNNEELLSKGQESFKVDYKDEFDESNVGVVNFEDGNKTTAKRHKHKSKKKNQDSPEYTIGEDGSYNIDTSDVTYLEGVETPTPSIKKARGDVPKQEKLKWWEIYKWADRMLAKRKVAKEVKKASFKIPEGIKKGGMIALCLFFGWFGIHNFYAKNNKKGWTVLAFNAIIWPIIMIPFFDPVKVSLGGGFGFAVSVMWITDLFALLFNKYKYRISKEEFISNLNVETRAKLGNKYISLDKKVFKEKEQARLEKKKRKKKSKERKL